MPADDERRAIPPVGEITDNRIPCFVALAEQLFPDRIRAVRCLHVDRVIRIHALSVTNMSDIQGARRAVGQEVVASL